MSDWIDNAISPAATRYAHLRMVYGLLWRHTAVRLL